MPTKKSNCKSAIVGYEKKKKEEEKLMRASKIMFLLVYFDRDYKGKLD